MDIRLKAILGTFGGIVAAAITVMLGEMILHSVSPPPTGINWEDPSAIVAYLGTLSSGQWLALIAVYFIAALVGGYVANLICKDIKYKPALITGVGLLVTTFLNFNSFGGHPTWVWVASAVAILAGAWLGGRLVGNSKA
jgi:hypothetical protein